MATADLLRAMCKSRKTMFRFNNPLCAECAIWVSECERLLIRMLQFMRRGDRSSAMTLALILCEGRASGPTLACAEQLVGVLDHAAAKPKSVVAIG